MAKEFYMRIRTAGRYKLVARYSRPLPGDSKPVKAAKQAATTTAQKYINIKNATERLQLLLCANFDSKEPLYINVRTQNVKNETPCEKIFSF